ncbi:unnamed protein product [Amoebophrya sp. A120]|nr:unnamed protein product [Amoebophrya sp. A120]|eukprot:GSA120T00008143001.1
MRYLYANCVASLAEGKRLNQADPPKRRHMIDCWLHLNPIDVDPFIAGVVARRLHGDREVSLPAFLSSDADPDSLALGGASNNAFFACASRHDSYSSALLAEEQRQAAPPEVEILTLKLADLLAQQFRQRNYLRGTTNKEWRRKVHWGTHSIGQKSALNCVPAKNFNDVCDIDTWEARQKRNHIGHRIGDITFPLELFPWGNDWADEQQDFEPGRLAAMLGHDNIDEAEFSWSDLVSRGAIHHTHFVKLLAGPFSLFSQTVASALNTRSDSLDVANMTRITARNRARAPAPGEQFRPKRDISHWSEDLEASHRYARLYPETSLRQAGRRRKCGATPTAEQSKKEQQFARREMDAARRFARSALAAHENNLDIRHDDMIQMPISDEEIDYWRNRPDSYAKRLDYFRAHGYKRDSVLHSVRYGSQPLHTDELNGELNNEFPFTDVERCMDAQGYVTFVYGVRDIAHPNFFCPLSVKLRSLFLHGDDNSISQCMKGVNSGYVNHYEKRCTVRGHDAWRGPCFVDDYPYSSSVTEEMQYQLTLLTTASLPLRRRFRRPCNDLGGKAINILDEFEKFCKDRDEEEKVVEEVAFFKNKKTTKEDQAVNTKQCKANPNKLLLEKLTLKGETLTDEDAAVRRREVARRRRARLSTEHLTKKHDDLVQESTFFGDLHQHMNFKLQELFRNMKAPPNAFIPEIKKHTSLDAYSSPHTLFANTVAVTPNCPRGMNSPAAVVPPGTAALKKRKSAWTPTSAPSRAGSPASSNPALFLPPGTLVFVDNLSARPELNGQIGIVGNLHYQGNPVESTKRMVEAGHMDMAKVFKEATAGGHLMSIYCSSAPISDFREHKDLRYAVRIFRDCNLGKEEPGSRVSAEVEEKDKKAVESSISSSSDKHKMDPTAEDITKSGLTVSDVLLRPQNLFRAVPTLAEKAMRLLRPKSGIFPLTDSEKRRRAGGRENLKAVASSGASSSTSSVAKGKENQNASKAPLIDTFWSRIKAPKFSHVIEPGTDFYPAQIDNAASFVFDKSFEAYRLYGRLKVAIASTCSRDDLQWEPTGFISGTIEGEPPMTCKNPETTYLDLDKPHGNANGNPRSASSKNKSETCSPSTIGEPAKTSFRGSLALHPWQAADNSIWKTASGGTPTLDFAADVREGFEQKWALRDPDYEAAEWEKAGTISKEDAKESFREYCKFAKDFARLPDTQIDEKILGHVDGEILRIPQLFDVARDKIFFDRADGVTPSADGPGGNGGHQENPDAGAELEEEEEDEEGNSSADEEVEDVEVD